jgi:hypothetical protein
MKIERTEFTKDKWGMYITPLIGYSNVPIEGKTFWVGWLRFLFKIYFK